MRKWLALVLMVLFVCAASAALAADPTNLVGTWEGATAVHSAKAGYLTGKMVLTVEGQQGSVFNGSKTYIQAATKKTRAEKFSGSISSDGRILIADHEEGFMVGTITKDGEMELQYAHQGKNAVAVRMLLKKK
ncbi:MAG: hypothetical protein HY795_06455 [Desulfovibrio sp.]|nr:hypothetical protein [Desulfovibrio sp.]MBI4961260.1 hypothetical protein [Desulfovibrio sp.]